MIFAQPRQIGFYDLDAFGAVKLTALLKYMNEASWQQAEELGCGIETTFEIGLAFIIQRMGVRILQLPTVNQQVIVRTWPAEMTRSAFKRNGEIVDTDGKKLVEWESLWVLIDINERKIKRPSAFPIEFPLAGKMGVTIEANKIVATDNQKPAATQTHTVQFSEMDLNHHMNNAIYGDLISNVLANTELPKINQWQAVQFNYLNEAKLNEVVTTNCAQAGNKLQINGNTSEKAVFIAEITTEG